VGSRISFRQVFRCLAAVIKKKAPDTGTGTGTTGHQETFQPPFICICHMHNIHCIEIVSKSHTEPERERFVW
jgi:hypothetical protein